MPPSCQVTGAPSRDLQLVSDVTRRLFTYCRERDWAGYDPYDALNSRVFHSLPFLNFRWPRLVFTQFMKRSPVNFRPVLRVPPLPNPKGLALFLRAVLQLQRVQLVDDKSLAPALADQLAKLRSPYREGWCWGYHFDWQNRTELVPKGMPNIICTTFAGNALLDLYETNPQPRFLEMAVGAAEFILNELFFTEDRSVACFSYTPLGHSKVHNANLLGAAYLCRLGRLAGQTKYFQPALAATRYTVGRQHADGSWAYGEEAYQQWIDSFHTGFNLCALREINRCAGTAEFAPSLQRGFRFFRQHFFLPGGLTRYYHDRTYPIDVHVIAQSILTLVDLADLDEGNLPLAHEVFQWSYAHLWDPRGYFYYQKHPYLTIRIPYMRWGLAWMLQALAALLNAQVSAAR